MRNRIICLLAVLVVVCIAIGSVSAQYYGGKTADFTIGSNGKVHIPQSQTQGNLDITIVGKPGASGSVSTVAYTADPQPGASKPENVTMSHFIVVTFNMNPSDFTNATVKINFSADEMAGIDRPYTLYKYIPETNTYIPLEATIDENALTATVVLTSTTDPLFAIGGPTIPAPTDEDAIPLSTYALIIGAIGIITALVVAVGLYQRRSAIKKAA